MVYEYENKLLITTTWTTVYFTVFHLSLGGGGVPPNTCDK